MEIGAKIKAARLAKGLTQEELGNMVGVQKSAIAKYENGRVVNIKRSTLQKLALALGLKGSDLISDINGNGDSAKPIAVDDGLPESVFKLIEFAKSVPEDKADIVLQVMKTIVEADQ